VSTDTLTQANDGARADERASERRNWLTVERAAYIGLLFLALWIRLLHLGQRPLDPDEAEQALAAWKLAKGVDVTERGLSPLLLSLQYLTFLLTGASDVTARIWPALVGSSMVVMPYALRKHLGRGAALFASLLLAFSPNLAFFSRQSIGHVLVAAASLGLLVCLLNWVQGGGERWFVGVGIAAGLLLISGPGAWLMLLVLAGATIWLQVGGRLDLSAGGKGVLPFVLTISLGSTALLLHWGGLGMAVDLLPSWLGSFAARSGPYPWYHPALRLALDEPLLLLAGLAGFGLSASRRNRLGHILGAWAAVALVVSTVAGGRQPGDLLLVVVPLAILAGIALDGLMRYLAVGWQSRDANGQSGWQGSRLEAALLAGVMLVLLVTSAIWMASYSKGYAVQYLWVTLAPVGLLVLVALLYGFWGGWDTALGVTAAVATTVLLAYAVSLSWGMNQDFSPDRRAAVEATQAAYGMRSLPSTLETLSANQVGDPHALPVDVVTRPGSDELQPLLGWALREFSHLRWSDRHLPSDPHLAVVASESLDLPIGESYAGQDFPLVTEWSPRELADKSLWRWILFREAPAAPPASNAVLWVRATTELVTP
jgi:hypothetical protein